MENLAAEELTKADLLRQAASMDPFSTTSELVVFVNATNNQSIANSKRSEQRSR